MASELSARHLLGPGLVRRARVQEDDVAEAPRFDLQSDGAGPAQRVYEEDAVDDLRRHLAHAIDGHGRLP